MDILNRNVRSEWATSRLAPCWTDPASQAKRAGSHFARSNWGLPKNLDSVVKKWGIVFIGNNETEIENFLAPVEKGPTVYGLSNPVYL